jgi:hypothetical protein
VFIAYIGELGWKSIVDMLKRICYLSSYNNDRKITAKKQRTDIGKYCFVNWRIKLWNQLSAEVLATFTCKSHVFRKRVYKVIILYMRCSGFLKSGDGTSEGAAKRKTGSGV